MIATAQEAALQYYARPRSTLCHSLHFENFCSGCNIDKRYVSGGPTALTGFLRDFFAISLSKNPISGLRCFWKTELR
jgi:hypothetical protein